MSLYYKKSLSSIPSCNTLSRTLLLVLYLFVYPGAFIEGPVDETFAAATNSIAKMLTENQPSFSSSPRAVGGGGGIGTLTPRGQDMKRLLEEKEEEVQSEKIQTVALSEQASSSIHSLIAVLAVIV